MNTLAADRDSLLAAVAEFMEREVAPRVAAYDRDERLPKDIVSAIAELGVFGGVVAEEHSGLGLDYVTFAELLIEVSKVDQVLATLVSMPSGLVGASIERYGTAEQKERWLAPLARGEIFGAAAVTEPQSGSDVAGMETRYRKEGSDFILSGTKAWISNLDIAEFFITFATIDRSLKHRGVTAFIVPRETPGLGLHPYEDKLGFRSLCTGDLTLDEVRLGPEHLLGDEGEGFRVAMTAVERGRLGVAARAVGVIEACLHDSVEYAKERIAFDQPISQFQLVQSRVADMCVGLETARLLVLRCATALQDGQRARLLTSMAKMYATDVAARAASDAVQLHGANGTAAQYRVSRMYRDAKVLQIVEGSNDLHRALIGELALGLRAAGE